ncbi:hypothetical protein DFH09DRAFT_1081923 [Mycena vulgaris]|nr:hypothetical protein DFH09DRAFT_1081923 [Mycena vulgaris]
MCKWKRLGTKQAFQDKREILKAPEQTSFLREKRLIQTGLELEGRVNLRPEGRRRQEKMTVGENIINNLADIDMSLCLLRREVGLLDRKLGLLSFNSQRASHLKGKIDSVTRKINGAGTKPRLDIFERTLVAVEVDNTGDTAREYDGFHRTADLVEEPTLEILSGFVDQWSLNNYSVKRSMLCSIGVEIAEGSSTASAIVLSIAWTWSVLRAGYVVSAVYYNTLGTSLTFAMSQTGRTLSTALFNGGNASADSFSARRPVEVISSAADVEVGERWDSIFAVENRGFLTCEGKGSRMWRKASAGWKAQAVRVGEELDHRGEDSGPKITGGRMNIEQELEPLRYMEAGKKRPAFAGGVSKPYEAGQEKRPLFGDKREPYGFRDKILRDILPGYFAYYSVLATVQSDLNPETEELLNHFLGLHWVLETPFAEFWHSWRKLAEERFDVVKSWADQGYISVVMCDNMKETIWKYDLVFLRMVIDHDRESFLGSVSIKGINNLSTVYLEIDYRHGAARITLRPIEEYIPAGPSDEDSPRLGRTKGWDICYTFASRSDSGVGSAMGVNFVTPGYPP